MNIFSISQYIHFVCMFVLLSNVPVNNYGHAEMVS